MEWILVKMVLSLIAVVAFMAALALVAKKIFFATRSSDTARVDIDLMGHRPLAPKRSVYVLRVMDRMIVVGATEQGMTLLSEWKEVPTVGSNAAAAPCSAEPLRAPAPFLQTLKNYFPLNGGNRFGRLLKSESYVHHGE